jgi:hypothetical protein
MTANFTIFFLLLHKQGPGGVWCDVDVVEFSYYGAPAPTPKEQLYDELVDGLRGSDPSIGSGSQVISFFTLHRSYCFSQVKKVHMHPGAELDFQHHNHYLAVSSRHTHQFHGLTL